MYFFQEIRDCPGRNSQNPEYKNRSGKASRSPLWTQRRWQDCGNHWLGKTNYQSWRGLQSPSSQPPQQIIRVGEELRQRSICLSELVWGGQTGVDGKKLKALRPICPGKVRHCFSTSKVTYSLLYFEEKLKALQRLQGCNAANFARTKVCCIIM